MIKLDSKGTQRGGGYLKEVNVYRLYPLGYYCYLYLYLTLYRVQSSGHREY